MKNYGLPYMGSKNRLATRIIDCLPDAPTFVDLFAGGCAVTHAAMESGRFARLIVNDIIADVPRFFMDCIEGKLEHEHRVITREEFFRLKDADPYVRICWSFGNNQQDYLWSHDIEPVKIAASRMIMADTWQERRKHYLTFVRELVKYTESQGGGEKKPRRIRDLEPLERLNRLPSSSRDGWSPWNGSADPQPHSGGGENLIHLNGKRLELHALEAVSRCDGLRAMHCPPVLPAQLGRLQGLESVDRLRGLSERVKIPENRGVEQSLSNANSPSTGCNGWSVTTACSGSPQELERTRQSPAVHPQPGPVGTMSRNPKIGGGEKFTLTGDSVQLFSLPYQDVYIPDASVVYCDPPYANTGGYLSDFDSAAFQDYVRRSPHLMVVSEYQMPEDFVAIAEFGHRSTLSGTNNAKRTVEKLFVHESKLAEYRERMEETKAKRNPAPSTAPTS
jgi:site-specific DNA-adenine methylase